MNKHSFKQEDWQQLNSQENLRLLQNLTTGQLVFERICTIPPYGSLEKYIEILDKRVKMSNSQYNLNLLDYTLLEEGQNSNNNMRSVAVRYEAYAEGLNKEFVIHVKKNQKWKERDLHGTIICLLHALKELHKNGLVHGDLRMSQIVLAENGSLKLADQYCVNFNNICSSSYIQRDSKLLSICAALLPPESLLKLRSQNDSMIISPEGDLWALGIILLEMGLLENIHSHIYDYEQFTIDLVYLQNKIKKIKQIWSKNSKLLRILEILLSNDPHKRHKVYEFAHIEPLTNKSAQLKEKTLSFSDISSISASSQHIFPKALEDQVIPELEEKDEQEDQEEELSIKKKNQLPFPSSLPLIQNKIENQKPQREQISSSEISEYQEFPSFTCLNKILCSDQNCISSDKNGISLSDIPKIEEICNQYEYIPPLQSNNLLQSQYPQQPIISSPIFDNEIIPPLSVAQFTEQLAQSIDYSNQLSQSVLRPLSNQNNINKNCNQLTTSKNTADYKKESTLNNREGVTQYPKREREQDENIDISNHSSMSSSQNLKQSTISNSSKCSKIKSHFNPCSSLSNSSHSLFTPSEKAQKGVFLLNSSLPHMKTSQCQSGMSDLFNSISPIKVSHSKTLLNHSCSVNDSIAMMRESNGLRVDEKRVHLNQTPVEALRKSDQNKCKIDETFNKLDSGEQPKQILLLGQKQHQEQLKRVFNSKSNSQYYKKSIESSPSLSASSAHLHSQNSSCYSSHNYSSASLNQQVLPNNCLDCSNYHNIHAFANQDANTSNVPSNQSLELSAHYGSLAISHLMNFINSPGSKKNEKYLDKIDINTNNLQQKILEALIAINQAQKKHSVSGHTQSSGRSIKIPDISLNNMSFQNI